MLFPSHTTGIQTTDKKVAWTVLRKTSAGIEKIREGSLPIPPETSDVEPKNGFPSDVFTEIRSQIRGLITIALPSSKLLMRVLELPSSDPIEIDGMVELQMDQISPFPTDQLTLSY